MVIINKEYLKNAFVLQKGKRRQLLYEYYKQDYFSNAAYSADFIADAISKDLEVPIDRNLIYQINARIVKKEKIKTINENQSFPDKSSQFPLQGKSEEVQNVLAKYNVRNADDIPKEKSKMEIAM